jgi:Ca2+-binding EF-hand superfamily protein
MGTPGIRGIMSSPVAPRRSFISGPRPEKPEKVDFEPKTLAQAEEVHIRELFNTYDYDDTGTLNITELRELLLMQQWAMDWKSMCAVVKNVIGDAELLSFEEFAAVYTALLSMQPITIRMKKTNRRIEVRDLRELEATARTQFCIFDEDDNGFLDIEEMKVVMREAELPDVNGDNYETMINEQLLTMDLNRDGTIDFEEFIKFRNAVLDHFFRNKSIAGLRDPNVSEELTEWATNQFVD